MNDRRSELRRLRGMQTEIGLVVVLIVAAILFDNHTLTVIVLLINVFLWALMLQETGRDIRSLQVSVPSPRSRSPTAEEVRMK